MVGNSSAGIKEAPFVETISIDIGTRQEGRARDCGVFHVRTHKALASTLNYLKTTTVDRAVLGERSFPYGKGNATDVVFSGLECIVKGEL
jgi:UDP-N-acetylglucosamine 2-epimerase